MNLNLSLTLLEVKLVISFPVSQTLSDPGEEMGRARNAGMCPSEERGEALHHPAVFYQFLVSDINFNQLE